MRIYLKHLTPNEYDHSRHASHRHLSFSSQRLLSPCLHTYMKKILDMICPSIRQWMTMLLQRPPVRKQLKMLCVAYLWTKVSRTSWQSDRRYCRAGLRVGWESKELEQKAGCKIVPRGFRTPDLFGVNETIYHWSIGTGYESGFSKIHKLP